MFEIITSPLFLVLLAVLVITFAFFSTPKGRGILGELSVKLIIGKNKAKGNRPQYVINDTIFEGEGGHTSQIDHIVINSAGVFVIETKNYSGRIYGSDERTQWTQVLNYGRVKNQFYSPVKQNLTHLYRVRDIIGAEYPIYSVVVFVKGNIQYIDSQYVCTRHGLRRMLRRKEPRLNLEEMTRAYELLLDSRSDIGARRHVQGIRARMRDIENGICPRCGAKMLLKNGRNGQFYGCSNYPRCRFTKNA